MVRADGRRPDQLRTVRITPNVAAYAEGSAMIEMGMTRVLCTASLENRVPPFLAGRGQGWITAEYGMLPRATLTRSPREAATGKMKGRTHEIARIIARALRTAIDLSAVGERTIIVDCDVLQADGGTRTASITGGYVALSIALNRMIASGAMKAEALKPAIAAVSVGIVDGVEMLDLAYVEDSTAQVDFNVVMNAEDRFIEVQGTAEGEPFSRDAMDRLVELAHKGIRELMALQAEAITVGISG